MERKTSFLKKIKVTFKSKSNSSLRRQNLLFFILDLKYTYLFLSKSAKLLKLPWGNGMLKYGIKKSLLFKQFCGGESIMECRKVIDKLATNRVGTILDFSIEGAENEGHFNKTISQLKETILCSHKNRDKVPFAVFKMTALVPIYILKELSVEIAKGEEIENLPESIKKEYYKLLNRVNNLCDFAYDRNVKLMIDAEESWLQDAIDFIALKMMRKYNIKSTIVINTYQMYLTNGLNKLMEHHKMITNEGLSFGVKIVRGAYIIKENKKFGMTSPICKTLSDTHENFNKGVYYCLDYIEDILLVVGTHNEESISKAKEAIYQRLIPKNSNKIYFAQLLGMGDIITYNLTNEQYNVVKYVPYGPIEFLIPYLVRRAQENSSVKGMSSRELEIIRHEMKRRKLTIVL